MQKNSKLAVEQKVPPFITSQCIINNIQEHWSMLVGDSLECLIFRLSLTSFNSTQCMCSQNKNNSPPSVEWSFMVGLLPEKKNVKTDHLTMAILHTKEYDTKESVQQRKGHQTLKGTALLFLLT